MPRASMLTAEALHEKLGEVLLNALTLGTHVTAVCECGNEVRVPFPAEARYVAEAIKWLKDNGINSIPVDGSQTATVAKNLPFPTTEAHERAAPGETGMRAKVLPFPGRAASAE